jgi:hypothetical protein
VAIAAAALQPAPQLIRPRKLPKAKAPWRKVLYEQQPYEDNHVDQAFLSMLITNQNVVILEFWEVVKVRARSAPLPAVHIGEAGLAAWRNLLTRCRGRFAHGRAHTR